MTRIIEQYLDGRRVPGAGALYDVYDPSAGVITAQLPFSTPEQIDAAVARYKAELDAQVKIQVEQMRAQMEHEREMRRVEVDGMVGMKQAESSAKPAVQIGGDEVGAHLKTQGEGLNQALMAMSQGMDALREAVSRPKMLVRGKDGRAVGVQ